MCISLSFSSFLFRSMCHMGKSRFVGSLKAQVSFAEYSLFYRALLQKTPIILTSLLVVAPPNVYTYICIYIYVSLSLSPPFSFALSFWRAPYKFRIYSAYIQAIILGSTARSMYHISAHMYVCICIFLALPLFFSPFWHVPCKFRVHSAYVQANILGGTVQLMCHISAHMYVSVIVTIVSY